MLDPPTLLGGGAVEMDLLFYSIDEALLEVQKKRNVITCFFLYLQSAYL